MQRVALTVFLNVSSRFKEIRDADRERGLTTTEIAVLTFVLVATAAAIGTLLYQYAQGRVENLPEDPAPEIPRG